MSVTLPASLSQPWPRREDFQEGSNYFLAVFSECLRTPLQWLCRRASGSVAPKPPQEWRNGVILGPSHIGDVLYNTAALPLLRAGLPHCKWTYVVSGPSAQVLEGNPCLNEIISIDDSGGFASRLRQSRAQLADHRFDVAIAYARSSWKDLTLAAWLGIPNRVGYVHKGFSGLVTHPVSIRILQPFPAYFRDLACQLVEQPPEAVPSLRPLVYLLSQHEEAVDELSGRLGLNWAKQPVLACAVTSRQASGVWPQEQFLQTVRKVREQEPCTVVYFGSKSDAAQLERLAGCTGSDTFVLAGDLDLLSMVAFLRRCRMALTSDSGPRHLASAAGVPVFFVRNLSFQHAEAGAYARGDYDMAPKDLEYLGPAEQSAAFARINPEKVAAQMVQLWRESGPAHTNG